MGKKIEKEIKSKKNTESNSKIKKFFLIIPIIVILAIALFFLLAHNPVEANDEANAQLIIDYGIVEVKNAGGSWKFAENGMFLFQSDSVRTGENTSASVILFKSSIIRLDSNTEITIREIIREEEINVTIDQNSGRTWNTVRKISGIDNYEVQTPTTVASVRGTSFVVDVTILGETFFGVVNGTVNVSTLKNGTILYSIDVKENESVLITPDKIHDPLKIKPLEKDDWIKENEIMDEEIIQNEKEEFYDRINPYIPQLKLRYGITDEEIDFIIEGYLRGYYADHKFPEGIPDWILEIIEIH